MDFAVTESDQDTIRVGLAGCGTVGGGVCEIVVNRADALVARTGLRFEIVRALVRDPNRERQVPLHAGIFTASADSLFRTPMDMLVEVMGGTGMAKDVVLRALMKGIPVVTANKALLAEHGAEVFGAAREHGTAVAFEASCAGGLPIVGALLRGLQANRIDEIVGIFNSTCNFVLTKMIAEGMEFADAVAEAQRLGYAEADPSLDVKGVDTAHKLAILSSLAFGANIGFDQVAVEGIEGLQLADLKATRELGYRCKLVGIGRRAKASDATDDAWVSLLVCPVLLAEDHALAGMDGTCSGMVTEGDAVGQVVFAGAGAGGLPTASAVVADMIEVASGAAQATFNHLRIYNDHSTAAQCVDPESIQTPYYLRFDTATPDAEAQVNQVLQHAHVGIREMHRLKVADGMIVLTEPVPRGQVISMLHTLPPDLKLRSEPAAIRILDHYPPSAVHPASLGPGSP